MNYLLKIGLTTIAVISHAISIAQIEDSLKMRNDLSNLSIEELGNIEIISTSRASTEPVSYSAANVFVVTAQQIDERGYTSLLEVLSDLPDIKIDRMNDPRWVNDVTIRGVRGSDKFIILQDGIRISPPTGEVIPIMENYPVNHALQIEIIFGPFSALYGADAFCGIINIITKNSDYEEKNTVFVSGGMYQKFTGNMLFSRKIGSEAEISIGGQYYYDELAPIYEYYKKDYLGVDSLKSGNFNTILGPMKPNTPVNPDFQYPLEAFAVYGKLKIRGIQLQFFRNAAQNSTAIANDPNNNIYNRSVHFKQGVTIGTLSHNLDNGRFHNNFLVTGSQYDLYPESNFRNVFTQMEPGYLFGLGRMLKFEEIFGLHVTDALSLMIGGTHERFFSIPNQNDYLYPISKKNPETGVWVNSVYDNNPGGLIYQLEKIRYSNSGTYFQLKYAFHSKLLLTTGVRYDLNSIYGNTINPRGAIVIIPNKKLTFKLLYGSAFLAPSRHLAYEHYGTLKSDDNGSTYYSDFLNLPNPDLKPQRMHTGEFTGKFDFTNSFSISVNTYYSHLSNFIAPVVDSTTDNLYNGMYQSYPVDVIQINGNLGEQQIYGATFLMTYIRNFERITLSFNSSLSWIDGEFDIDDDPNTKNRNLPGIAPIMIKSNFTLSYMNWSFSPRIIYLNKQRTFNNNSVQSSDPFKYQEIDGYVLLNGTIQFKYKDQFTFYVLGENLLDQRYRSVNIGASPDATASGSAQAELEDGAPQQPIRLTIGAKMYF